MQARITHSSAKIWIWVRASFRTKELISYVVEKQPFKKSSRLFRLLPLRSILTRPPWLQPSSLSTSLLHAAHEGSLSGDLLFANRPRHNELRFCQISCQRSVP